MVCRENGLMLYGPMPNSTDDDFVFDIVLPVPASIKTNSAFRLINTFDINYNDPNIKTYNNNNYN